MTNHILLDRLINSGFNIYPDVLGFNYQNDHPPIDTLDKYDYVFIRSDFGTPLKTKAIQLMTGATESNTYSWDALCFDYDVLPLSEYTETPTIGFVGRIPIFDTVSGKRLHAGFEDRYTACQMLSSANSICFDAHIRFDPIGDSAGFWNNSIPNRKKWEPLFKTNMLANQYALTARGNGNYAQRLYESLCYGRIPVYIDSNGKIPWDDFINYQDLDFMVWNKDIKDLELDILTFHETHDLHTTQATCKIIHNTHLTLDSQEKLFETYHSEMKPYKW